jgi:hypothetical protein
MHQEDIELATEGDDEIEEALEYVKDQWYVTNVNN